MRSLTLPLPPFPFCHSRARGNPGSVQLILVGLHTRAIPWRHLKGACGRGCAPVPNSMWGRGLFERSEFRSPNKRDRGKGTRRAAPGRPWFWVLLPKQKDLAVWGRNPTFFPSSCGAETPREPFSFCHSGLDPGSSVVAFSFSHATTLDSCFRRNDSKGVVAFSFSHATTLDSCFRRNDSKGVVAFSFSHATTLDSCFRRNDSKGVVAFSFSHATTLDSCFRRNDSKGVVAFSFSHATTLDSCFRRNDSKGVVAFSFSHATTLDSCFRRNDSKGDRESRVCVLTNERIHTILS